MIARTAEERLILARAALIKAEEARERKQKLRAERKARGTLDRGRERDNGYLAFLRRQPCRIGLVRPGTCCGPIEACHIRYGDADRGKINAGLSVKPSDRFATSCCAGHHREQHSFGNERRWWATYGLDGLEVAASQYAAYLGGDNAIVG